MKRPADIYTLEGLAWLKQELLLREEQWDSYSGNNPNKGEATRRALRREIEVVSSTLKRQGVLEWTDAERLKHFLDRQTPSRLKGCCTQFEGQWYKFKLTGKDDRGCWEWTWEPVTLDVVDGPGSYIHPGRNPR